MGKSQTFSLFTEKSERCGLFFFFFFGLKEKESCSSVQPNVSYFMLMVLILKRHIAHSCTAGTATTSEHFLPSQD